jgi:branched-chain amino acid transport system substrate-binding protein
MRFIRCVLLPGCVLLALPGCKSQGEPGPILIGHVAPLSGPEKRSGEHARQAILLAVEEVNKEDNRAGGRRVAVLHIDSHGDLDALQPEVVRLITVNRVVALFGGVNTVEVERLGRAAQPYEAALLTPATVPKELMTDNVFSICASPATQGRALADVAANELKANRVAVLADGRRPASAALAEAFIRRFSEVGGQAPRQWVYTTEADLAKTAVELKEAKAEAILCAGAATDLAKVRALLKTTGFATPLLLADDGEQPSLLEAGSKGDNAIYLATPYVLDRATPELQEFLKEYKKRFHEEPGSDALLAYDGVRVLCQAIRRAKITSPATAAANVRAVVGSGEFESLTGRLVFNKDHCARRPLFVVHFENGKVSEVKSFDPSEQ